MVLPKPLLDDIVNGRCLPFIGAGFSKNAVISDGETMPTWNELATIMSSEIPFDTKKSTALEIAQEYEKQFGRPQLIKFLEEKLCKDRANPGDVHKYFAKIKSFELVYTTNFDMLLESSYRNEGRLYKSLSGEKQLALSADPPTVNIVKMHGDLEHPEYLIFTKEDFEGYAKNYPVIATHLSAMLITKTPFFIGYSITDPNLIQIKEIIQERLGSYTRRGYVVVFDPLESDMEKYQKMHLSVIPLYTTTKSKSELLLELLKEICDYYQTTYIFEKPTPTTAAFEELRSDESSSSETFKKHPADNSILDVFRAISDIERSLEFRLQKNGAISRTGKNSLTSLGQHAFRIGLFSSEQLSLVNDIMGMRNAIVHRNRIPSAEELGWMIYAINRIKERLESTDIPKTVLSSKIWADKKLYYDDDKIIIRGVIKSLIKKIPVVLEIIDPIKNRVKIIQCDMDNEGSFLTTIYLSDGSWKNEGNYTIRAGYGLTKLDDEITFEFKHRVKSITATHSIKIEDRKFDLNYEIRGGKLLDITPDQPAKCLVLSIESITNGSIELTIPRDLFDAKTNEGQDDSFFVLVDGGEVNFKEKIDDNARTLTIDFLKGDSEIEVIGTQIMPLERISIDSIVIENTDGKKNNKVRVNKPLNIICTIRNRQKYRQKFALMVQIQDNDGVTVDLLSNSSILEAYEQSIQNLSWLPNSSGVFDITAFVWEGKDNPSALSPPLSTSVSVTITGNETEPRKIHDDVGSIISKLDTIMEIYREFPPIKNQLNAAIKLYESCWKWAKENIPSKEEEIKLLKVKPVSIWWLVISTNVPRELKAIRDELLTKSKKLKSIIKKQSKSDS